MIIHFTKEQKPMLLKILDAGDFGAALTKAAVKADKEEVINLAV